MKGEGGQGRTRAQETDDKRTALADGSVKVEVCVDV